MFIHHLSKFDKFSLKIGGEIICQTWLLFTPYFNLPIVHWLHLKGLCPVCVVMLLCRWPEEAWLYLQWLHLYVFSSVCLCLMCIFKSPVVMLEYSHIVHLWGFSPEWVLLCCFSLPEWVVVKSHWLHWCGFSPVCFLMCFLKWEASLAE